MSQSRKGPEPAAPQRAAASPVPLDGSTIRVGIRDLFPDGQLTADTEDREHVLVVTDGPGRGLSLRLASDTCLIGRSPPADLVLPDSRVSRSHCEVRLMGSDILVIDQGSTNGSFIGRLRVVGSGMLPRDGMLRVGDHLIRHRFWTRRELEEWQRINVPEPVFEVRIDIDERQRREEVAQIMGSQYFRDIVTEIDRLQLRDDR